MKLSETQQKALDIVQEIIKEDKITLQQTFDLITAIYEKEIVYISYPDPYPWYEQTKIMRGENNINAIQADPNKPGTPIYSPDIYSR